VTVPRARRPLLIVLALISTLSFTGCSGSGSSSSTPAKKTLAKADYITQGDAICKDLNTKLQALAPPASETDGKSIANYLRQGALLAEGGVNRLDALGRPDTDAPLIETILAEQRDTVTKARAAAGVFDSGDLAGGNAALQAIDGTSSKANADSKQFGFKVCGQDT
jgi:hypothetical protein